MQNEAAVFRPPLRGLAPALLLGAAGGGAVALVASLAGPEVPLIAGSLLGALAAGLSLAARHARGLRLVADEAGLRVLGCAAGSGLQARWEDVRLGFGVTMCDADGTLQRYAILADPQGRGFAFADRAGGAPCRPVTGADGRPVEVVDLGEAALLLGLVVQRTPAWHVLPESLQAAPAIPPVPTPTPTETSTSTSTATTTSASASTPTRERRFGLFAVFAKLGSKLAASAGKLGAGALKAAKTANLGWAAASAATYSLLFSWKFALAILIQLFVHEYGHVHAMRKTGMRVRGMYFVPMLGALAVTDDAFTSRRQQAYVALNGPLWGSLLALVPLGLFFLTHDPLWASIASWWALLNLFNLLPIAPLDGGRVMHAFASSYSSALGVALSMAGLAVALVLGLAAGFSIVWLVALLGAMELAGEARSRAGAHALRLLPEPARFHAPHWLYLRAAAGPPPGAPSQPAFLFALERQEKTARAVPLRGGEFARWGLAYLGLAAALVFVLWLLRSVPGASAAAGLLE